MKTGETVRDEQGQTYQVGQLLGRGLWGRTYAARGPDGEVVIKRPHTTKECGSASLAAQCREIAHEQLRILSQGLPGMVGLIGHFKLPDDTPILVLERLPHNLERRLASGGTLEEVLTTAVNITRLLQQLGDALPAHGNLHAHNVLLDEHGEVRLSDPLTPALRRALPQLSAHLGAPPSHLPPELIASPSSAPLNAAVDTFCTAALLYRGAMATEGTPPPRLPAEGLDKAALVALKDQVVIHLKGEHSNPRFHTRCSDRLATLLNRALSRETSPSPPYRFHRRDEFLRRTTEVLALVHPTVSQVGRLLVDIRPGTEAFSTDDEVRFSCTVACSPGVEDHEEIACGLAIFDIHKNERLRDLDSGYSVDRHPSGRYRFGFKLPSLPPGNYRVRVAFAIRESGEEPATTEGNLSVRAAPGYVPPKPAPKDSSVIPLAREPETDAGVTAERPVPLPPPREGWLDPDDHGPTVTQPPPAATELPTPSPRQDHVAVKVPERPAPAPKPTTAPTPIAPPRSRPTTPGPRLTSPGPRPTSPGDRPTTPTVVSPPVVRAPPPRPTPVEEPVPGGGRWDDYPIPNSGLQNLPDRPDKPTAPVAPPPREPAEPSGPIGEFLARALQLIKDDAYILFLGAAALVILLLTVLLIALR